MVDGHAIRGCVITVRPIDTPHESARVPNPECQAIPTLGEIVDRLALEYPERAWECAPAHRGLRVRSIAIHDR